MIRYFIFLLIPFYLFALNNPYKEINQKEKLNILINHFVNNEIVKVIPAKPVRDKVVDNSVIKRIKSEEYFAFIQRVKLIKEKRAKEKLLLDKEYEEKVKKHNNKLDELEEFYSKKENIDKLLQEGFNKSFTIVYGKPKLKDVYFETSQNKIIATLYIANIFSFDEWGDRKVIVDVPTKLQKRFLDYSRSAKGRLYFDYKNNIAILKGVKIYFDKHIFDGKFIENISYKVKIKLKIDKKLFKKVVYDRDK